MADNDDPKRGFSGGPPPLPSPAGRPFLPPPPPSLGKPPLPGLPPGRSFSGGLPPLPGAGSPPSFSPRPAAPAASAVDDEKEALRKKLAEAEKKFQEQKEKLLISDIKRQEEAANAARVEISIKELQDKLRRDRRESEAEETRLKLEGKLQELESRLGQERETWVATLKNQMSSRENQDKEVEAHFAVRMQEVERKALEEKAQWQKLVLAKDEDMRNLRALCERLKGADTEFQKVSHEKKWIEQRLTELTNERAQMTSRIDAAALIEKESIVLRAEMAALRVSAKEREDRWLSEAAGMRTAFSEKENQLRIEVDRVKTERESELSRIKLESSADLNRYREAASRAVGEAQRLREIARAIERQAAAAQAKLRLDLKGELDRQTTRLAEHVRQGQETAVRSAVERAVAETTAKLQAEWEKDRRELESELDFLQKELLSWKSEEKGL